MPNIFGSPKGIYGYLVSNALHSLYTHVQLALYGCASLGRAHTLNRKQYSFNEPNIFIRAVLSREAIKVEVIMVTSHNLNSMSSLC